MLPNPVEYAQNRRMNWLERQITARPDAVAVVEGPAQLTYKQLGERVSRTAAALKAAGVSHGSRVATLMANSIQHVVAIHAVAWAGATLVPINPRLSDDEISWLLNDASADMLVIDHGSSDRELDLENTKFVQVEELTFSLDSNAAAVDPAGIATLIYTSGTTGVPKPVPLTWANHSASATASAFNLGLNQQDNWLCCLPLCHIGGLAIVYRSAIYGTALTLTERFETDEVAEIIAAGQVTLASFVPTMLRRLWFDHEGFTDQLASGRLRAVLLGGGPADRETLEMSAKHNMPVYQTYGLTEAASQVTTMPPAQAIGKLGSAGIPVHGADVMIRDKEGEPLEANETGLIFIRGPMVTSGYLDRPAENARRFEGPWFDTGDFGYMDEDGFLWVVARRDDLIVTGGENVYPAEVESVLLSHPSVGECAVFGIPDKEWGQKVAAAVVLDEDATEDQLIAFCRDRLASFKLPRKWYFMSELPRTASGKIRRTELRK